MLAIIAVISAIVITGQSGYNQSIVLNDTAYTVAFSIREVQSLGLGSRTSGGVTNAGYGIRFAGTTGYTVFADTGGPVTLSSTWCPRGSGPEAKPGNCRYDTTDTIVKSYTMSRNFTVSNICAKTGSGAKVCGLTGLDVVFMRPETRAILTGSNGTSYTCAEVHVAAPGGTATRTVRVSQLGEISVGQICS